MYITTYAYDNTENNELYSVSGEPSSALGRSASLMMHSEMITSSMLMERRLTVAVLLEKTKYSL